jgi:hypothetical protein
MKTILCPVDFTPQSDRLLKYVGNLAKDRGCKIYLISTNSAKKRELVVEGSSSWNYKLDEMHDYFSGIMGIPCAVIEESLSGNIYKKLGSLADSYDIMATLVSTLPDGGVNDINLKKVIQDTLAPILIIPDRFAYRPIKRLLYAYDYKHELEPPLMQLNWLADWFNAEIVFVTLLPGDSSLKEESKLNAIRSAIQHSWIGSHPISFETIVYPNLPKGFEHYLGLSDSNDLLLLSVNHQNILERIWHKRVVKGVLQYAQHPYLIIHE